MKKDMISIIVGKIKNDKKKSEGGSRMSEDMGEEEGAEEGENYGKESAAEALLEAIHDEDTKGVIEALESFIECCKED